MKKIHNVQDLRREQRAVEQRRLQLEKELQRDWNDMKHDLSSESNSFFGSIKNRYTTGLLTQGLSFGAGLIAKKFGGKIGGKIYSWFK